MRSFDSLSEKEILALAISLEEEDERVCGLRRWAPRLLPRDGGGVRRHARRGIVAPRSAT
jgi:hypothetical protein